MLTWEDNLDLPVGFSDYLWAWGASPAWSDNEQGEFRRSSCTGGLIPTGIRFYLHAPTLGVHEMDDLVEQFHMETDSNLYDYDALFTGGM